MYKSKDKHKLRVFFRSKKNIRIAVFSLVDGEFASITVKKGRVKCLHNTITLKKTTTATSE